MVIIFTNIKTLKKSRTPTLESPQFEKKKKKKKKERKRKISLKKKRKKKATTMNFCYNTFLQQQIYLFSIFTVEFAFLRWLRNFISFQNLNFINI